MVVKFLLARANPQIRSVMPRRGTTTIAWGEEQWKKILEIVEEEKLYDGTHPPKEKKKERKKVHPQNRRKMRNRSQLQFQSPLRT